MKYDLGLGRKPRTLQLRDWFGSHGAVCTVSQAEMSYSAHSVLTAYAAFLAWPKGDRHERRAESKRPACYCFPASHRVQADWKKTGWFPEKDQIQTDWLNPSCGDIFAAQARWVNLGGFQLGKKSVETRKEDPYVRLRGQRRGSCQLPLISPSSHNSPANASPQVRTHSCLR